MWADGKREVDSNLMSEQGSVTGTVLLNSSRRTSWFSSGGHGWRTSSVLYRASSEGMLLSTPCPGVTAQTPDRTPACRHERQHEPILWKSYVATTHTGSS